MISDQMSPIQKAIRDLEAADLELLLQVAGLLPKLRESGAAAEIRAVKHDGWRLWTVNRKSLL